MYSNNLKLLNIYLNTNIQCILTFRITYMYVYFNFTVHFNYFKAREKINKMNLIYLKQIL